MLDVVLQILSVLGILILVFLGLVIAVILLVLFFPITYQVSGESEGKNFSLNAKVDWLFGLIRARCAYPDPGKLTVKALWFTVFDSKKTQEDQEQHGPKRKKALKSGPQEKVRGESSQTKTGEQESPKEQEKQKESQEISQPEELEISETQSSKSFSDSVDSEGEAEQADSPKGFKICEKLKKFKYTFCTIYDKIKKIWQNITYYVEIIQDRETRLLFLHVKSRVWKILKSIRPRKLRAQILFGTGSPDTTGYAYGVYGMLLPLLGPDVIVTPDFCQAVLEGSFYAAGHITIAVLLWHTIKILLDKRLRRFWDKLKRKDRDE